MHRAHFISLGFALVAALPTWAQDVPTYTPTPPYDIARIQSAETRQLTTFDATTRNKTKRIPRGQRVVIGEVKGKGCITNLWMTFPGWFWQHWAPGEPISPTILKNLILRIYWDGDATPAVEVPVGDFFGIGLCEVQSFESKYFGMSSGGFFCKFPMPFRRGFRIELENMDKEIDTQVFMNVLYQIDESLPDNLGYFHAQFRTDDNEGPEPLLLAEFYGKGEYVGCTLAMQGRDLNYLSFLEAPEYIFIDHEWEQARIIGTGLEDYFLGGWYFREGEFHGALHGVPVKDALRATVAMYRVHEGDKIHFANRFRFEFISPWDRQRLKPYVFSSVAFAYIDTPTGMGLPFPSREKLLCWYRYRDTDHQSIP